MCTFERRSLFTTRPIVGRITSELLHSAAFCEVEIPAYCFMPDHLHYLAEGLTESADLERFTRRFRQRSGYTYRRKHDGYLCQDGYFDRHLRNEDATFDVVSYIVANPVRGGLCAT